MDVLVNNAGVLDTTPLGQVTRESFDHSFAVNVRAPFFIIQRALPLLRDGGRVINVSSAVTRIASPFVHYAMGKGAIEVLGHTLAQLLGSRGITVNSVSPGVVDTDLGAWVHAADEIEQGVVSTIAHGRIGRPDDIADVVRSSPRTTRGGSPAPRSTRAAAPGWAQPAAEPGRSAPLRVHPGGWERARSGHAGRDPQRGGGALHTITFTDDANHRHRERSGHPLVTCIRCCSSALHLR